MKHYIEKRRDTTHVRISAKWHRQVKMMAAREGTTIAKVIDHVCRFYFEKPQDEVTPFGGFDVIDDYREAERKLYEESEPIIRELRKRMGR